MRRKIFFPVSRPISCDHEKEEKKICRSNEGGPVEGPPSINAHIFVSRRLRLQEQAGDEKRAADEPTERTHPGPTSHSNAGSFIGPHTIHIYTAKHNSGPPTIVAEGLL